MVPISPSGRRMMTGFETFARECNRFRAWAATIPIDKQVGEWEVSYEDWSSLSTAFITFISTSLPQHWTAEMFEDVLYIIARDNEAEELVAHVAEYPNTLIILAEKALSSSEWNAKWQIAVELSRLEMVSPKIEGLIFQFAHDTDEYVRRRAFMALADIGSVQSLQLVDEAWKSQHEYQRIAVLYVLSKLHSPLLQEYVNLAQVDGRPYLLSHATRISAEHSIKETNTLNS
jgi:HEAT repeats